jgi:hypothetical protein
LTAFTTLYIEKYFDQEGNAIPAMRPAIGQNQASCGPAACAAANSGLREAGTNVTPRPSRRHHRA